MKRLYLRALKRLREQANVQMNKKINNTEIQDLLRERVNIKMSDLVRLPLNQVRTVLKVPCPIQKINEEEIQIYKNLRRTYHIVEANVCEKCLLFDKCPVASQQPQPKIKSKLSFLLLFMIRLSQIKKFQVPDFRWQAAFKTAEALRISLRQSSTLKQQSIIFQEVTKIEEDSQISSNLRKNQSKINKKNYQNRQFHLK